MVCEFLAGIQRPDSQVAPERGGHRIRQEDIDRSQVTECRKPIAAQAKLRCIVNVSHTASLTFSSTILVNFSKLGAG
ncbi:hypothetical protein D3C84_456080 [compost metagenome]